MKRLVPAVVPALVLLSGCFGTRGVPDAAPDEKAPGPSDTVGDGGGDDPEPAPEPPADADVPLATVSPALSERLPPDLVTAVRRARGRFDTAESAADVAAAWRAADALAPRLEEALTPAFEAQGEPMALDLSWLTPSLPGMSETYMAEGTALVFLLDLEPWTALAAKTPEPSDDAFFALMERAWGSARPMGWPSWTARTWDYGGCSALGQGVVLEVLVLADAAHAAGPEFHEEIAPTRKLALDHVLQDDELFPRCNPNTLQPTATGELQGEAKRILEQIRLSEEERGAIEKRMPELVGQVHTGG